VGRCPGGRRVQSGGKEVVVVMLLSGVGVVVCLAFQEVVDHKIFLPNSGALCFGRVATCFQQLLHEGKQEVSSNKGEESQKE
jgi:hypothetical protein